MKAYALLASTLVALGAGCAPEDVQQETAREGVEAHVEGLAGYDGDVHCTDAAKVGYLVETETNVFLCAARRSDGDCDWFRADLEDGRLEGVRLDRLRAGCILPI
jgi:hypothetical protein